MTEQIRTWTLTYCERCDEFPGIGHSHYRVDSDDPAKRPVPGSEYRPGPLRVAELAPIIEWHREQARAEEGLALAARRDSDAMGAAIHGAAAGAFREAASLLADLSTDDPMKESSDHPRQSEDG